jgi:hypothetical protein
MTFSTSEKIAAVPTASIMGLNALMLLIEGRRLVWTELQKSSSNPPNARNDD